jgi:hypothetical protein
MRVPALVLAAAVACAAWSPACAVEGSSGAGPIGGTDIRNAMLPPPGFYGGAFALYAEAREFNDGNGNPIPMLSALEQRRVRAGPFFLWVPDVQVFGGSLGLLAVVPTGVDCGRLFPVTQKHCIAGFGDPYVEVGWSRFFGTMRPSRYAGALPIPEGLSLAFGFGTVLPFGKYDATEVRTFGATLGNNLWVFAPTAAFTYVTPPIIAEGTEFSARLYWNNYLTNRATQYTTGTLLNTDFAVTERIGRVQFGAAGFYATQVEDDKRFGARVAPDGRRIELLQLGIVVAYDLPEYQSSIKVKALRSIITHNAVGSFGVVMGWVTKL